MFFFGRIALTHAPFGRIGCGDAFNPALKFGEVEDCVYGVAINRQHILETIHDGARDAKSIGNFNPHLVVRTQPTTRHVLPFLIDILAQQHAPRMRNRTVGNDLRILAIDVAEKVKAVLYILNERRLGDPALTYSNAPGMRLLDSPFSNISPPLLPDRGNELLRRKTRFVSTNQAILSDTHYSSTPVLKSFNTDAGSVQATEKPAILELLA